jgi:hypothetical protein
MSKVSTEFVVYRDSEDGEEEIILEINGWAEPYVPANFRGHPDNWTPEEGGDTDIEEILYNGEPWEGTLTPSEESCACAQLAEALEGLHQAALENAAEARAEAKRERFYSDWD